MREVNIQALYSTWPASNSHTLHILDLHIYVMPAELAKLVQGAV
jgi:hypothetical protein